VLFVRVVLAVANSLYFSYLFLGRFNPSPTLPIGVETAQKPINTVVVSEKLQSDKEVSYAN
jgi:hypothetical protein